MAYNPLHAIYGEAFKKNSYSRLNRCELVVYQLLYFKDGFSRGTKSPRDGRGALQVKWHGPIILNFQTNLRPLQKELRMPTLDNSQCLEFTCDTYESAKKQCESESQLLLNVCETRCPVGGRICELDETLRGETKERTVFSTDLTSKKVRNTHGQQVQVDIPNNMKEHELICQLQGELASGVPEIAEVVACNDSLKETCKLFERKEIKKDADQQVCFEVNSLLTCVCQDQLRNMEEKILENYRLTTKLEATSAKHLQVEVRWLFGILNKIHKKQMRSLKTQLRCAQQDNIALTDKVRLNVAN